MTYYFYDLETSGFNPSSQRIMQFGGIRTDENFKPIGEPLECYIKLTNEVVPTPQAILVTGITPQKALEEGYSEAEFIKIFNKQVLQPNTTIVGYNNINFDDEFIRNLMYRNLYDPYEWHWKEGRTRWDLLNVVRMMRALRPDGLEWPVDGKGVASNKLDQLSVANKIGHSGAHTALADVKALIDLTKLLKAKQGKLFNYLANNHNKSAVASLVDLNKPQVFIHSSGKIKNELFNTSAFYPLFKDPQNPQAIICYDLRYSPDDFKQYSADDLGEMLYSPKTKDSIRPPIKGVHLNKCPAVAPAGVLDDSSQQRIGLSLEVIQNNLNSLKQSTVLINKLEQAYKNESGKYKKIDDVDFKMYDGFIGDKDKDALNKLQKDCKLQNYQEEFLDDRLNQMLPRYKARNYYKDLDDKAKASWEEFRAGRLENGIEGAPSVVEYYKQLDDLISEHSKDKHKAYLIEELNLYMQSIMP